MLREQLFEHPLSVIAGCAIWIPVGIWVVSLLSWAVQADIDFLTAFAGILVTIGVGMTAMISRDPLMAPLTLGGMVATLIVAPIARGSFNRRALDKIDLESIRRAYEALERSKSNAPAKFKLARTIYNKGLAAHALAIAEDAINGMPESTYYEEHRILKTWRYYRIPPGQDKSLNCLECGESNEPGLTHCQNCGARFLLDHARGAWLGKGLAKKFIAAWIAIVVALVGIPFALQSLPSAVAAGVIVSLMLLAGFVLFMTFRPGGK